MRETVWKVLISGISAIALIPEEARSAVSKDGGKTGFDG
jgi:hypothetical protein